MTLLDRLKEEGWILNLPAAEIGVAEGRSSLDFLKLEIPTLYMVDIWECRSDLKGDAASSQEWHDKNFREAKQKVAKFGDRAIIRKGLSIEMSRTVQDRSLGFIFLDAGHDYKSVWNDLLAWYPKVIERGLVCGHDYLNTTYQIKEAVDMFVTYTGLNTKIEVFGKTEDACFCFRKGK